MQERRVFLTDLGEVKIKKRKGSRRLSIRINPSGKVSVNVPWYVTYREAEKFLYSKKDWVRTNLGRLENEKLQRPVFTANNIPPTHYHEFIISRVPAQSFSRKYSQSVCEISIPSDRDISDPDIQGYIGESIVETYRKEAKIILAARCRDLAEKHGYRINEIRIKKMKTRWGSCSSKGNINLNLFLMALPKELADYVILHELVHTKHMNHSSAFWNELGKIVMNPRSVSREIRKHSAILKSFED